MPNSSSPQLVEQASKKAIRRAVFADAVGWILPSGVGTTAALMSHFLGAPSAVTVIVGAIGIMWSLSVIAYDAHSLRRYGYTDGFMKHDLRVIDPVDDAILWKARLQRKSVRKLLLGAYEIVDIGSENESRR